MTVRKLKALCKRAACRETAYEPLQHMWSPDDPLSEHCGAVAHVVREMFGGEILSGRDAAGTRWFWNRMPDGDEMCLVTGKPPKNGRPVNFKGVNRRWELFSARVAELHEEERC